MPWNWQRPDWPRFSYDTTALVPLEQHFLRRTGEFVGAFKHIGPDDKDLLKLELVAEEALKTSAIEGEILDRDSVQSSLRHEFGLGDAGTRARPAERGIAQMMADLYTGYAAPLSHNALFAWHSMLMSGQRALEVIGGYRTHAEPMQVVSGRTGKRRVYFEAPPSANVQSGSPGRLGMYSISPPSSSTRRLTL